MNRVDEVDGTAVELQNNETLAQPQQIALNAQIVDQAYQELKKALAEKLSLDLTLAQARGLSAKDRDALQQKKMIAHQQVTIAETEVQRVNALMNYFQLEVMYRTSQPTPTE